MELSGKKEMWIRMYLNKKIKKLSDKD